MQYKLKCLSCAGVNREKNMNEKYLVSQATLEKMVAAGWKRGEKNIERPCAEEILAAMPRLLECRDSIKDKSVLLRYELTVKPPEVYYCSGHVCSCGYRLRRSLSESAAEVWLWLVDMGFIKTAGLKTASTPVDFEQAFQDNVNDILA
jgi:hypothetical protein